VLDTSPNSRNEGLVELVFRDSIFSRADTKPLTRHFPSLRTHVFVCAGNFPPATTGKKSLCCSDRWVLTESGRKPVGRYAVETGRQPSDGVT
jgi:hypothetical protein